MKLKNLLFISLLTLCIVFARSAKAIDIQFDLKQTQKQIESELIKTPEIAKQNIYNALEQITKEDNKTLMNFGNVLKEEIKNIPQKERTEFLKSLRKHAANKDLLKSIDYYFLVEEGLAKKDFTLITVKTEAQKIVNKLQENLFIGNEKSLASITRTIKTDMVKIMSQENNRELIETFTKAYYDQALIYGHRQYSLNLFLSELTQNNLILKLFTEKTPSAYTENLYRNTLPSLMWQFSVQNFVSENQAKLIKDILKESADKSSLKSFLNMLSEMITDKSLPRAERQMLAKISVLQNMTILADPVYQTNKSGHVRIPWNKGERTLLRVDALEYNFGDLTPKNAKTLNKMLKDVPLKELQKVLPDAKEWVESFTKWAEKNIKPKGNTILTLSAMVAVNIAEEVIRTYTDHNPSTAYLDNIDEISDTLANGNTLKLVYNSTYDNNFANAFAQYLEEDNLTLEQQKDYLQMHYNFEKALYATFFEQVENDINEMAWQCFALNENCTKS